MDRHVITERGRPVSVVAVGPGAATELGGLLPERSGRRSVVVFAQPSTHELAARVAASLGRRGLRVAVAVLPDGEDAKTLTGLEDAYAVLNRSRLTRLDTVVGVGGGALTDAAGFVAATYLRGIEFAAVPTPLLGAVDAAIGGKTAVNVGGKNLVGAFHHPAAVAVDLDVLAGLPRRLLAEGAAEVLKAGLVADPVILARYEERGLDAPLADLVDRAVRIKVEVVSEDAREHGRRAILNLGHTIGHAVEHVGGISHGAAVAIGLVAAATISPHVLGFAEEERVRSVLTRLGLPVAAPGLDEGRVRAAIALDKKRDAGGVRMVLLEAVGVPRVTPVDDAVVGYGLAAVGIAPTRS